MKNNFKLLVGLFLINLSSTLGQTTGSSIKNNDKVTNHINNNEPAKVFVSFIVETTGKITNVRIDKTNCKNCSKQFKKNLENEAIRIIKSTPDFEPRKEKTRYILPIKFEITTE